MTIDTEFSDVAAPCLYLQHSVKKGTQHVKRSVDDCTGQAKIADNKLCILQQQQQQQQPSAHDNQSTAIAKLQLADTRAAASSTIYDSKKKKKKKKKIQHRQPCPLRGSSPPLSPFELARVVLLDRIVTHVVGKPAPGSQHLKHLGQYVSSPGHNGYCYAELAVFFPSGGRSHR